MTWSSLLSNPPAELALRFRTGARRSTDGEKFLTVHGAGVVTLERRVGDDRTLAEGRLSSDEVRSLFALASSSGLPEMPARTVPPGPGMIALELAHLDDELPLVLHRSFVNEEPRVKALVDALDALCARLATHA